MEKLTRKKAEKLMETEGEARGENIKVDWEVVRKKYGEEGLKKVEKRMAELGYPLKLGEIRTMDFYPLGLELLSMLVIKEVFEMSEKDLEEMGALAVTFSIFIKLFLRYFTSISLVANQIPAMFRKHYTVGEMEITEINEEENYLVAQVRDFDIHPVYCSVFKGYFSKVMKFVKGKDMKIKETKCSCQGDSHHEFFITW